MQDSNGTASGTASLAEMVKSRLKDKDMNQKALAHKVGVDEAQVSNLLKEHKVPSDPLLVRMATELELPLDKVLLHAAVLRLRLRLRANDETLDGDDRSHIDKAAKTYESILAQVCVDDPPKRSPRPYVTLEDFPRIADGPWCVIIGDRRERPPKSIGDLIALSVGSPDFLFLPALDLPKDTVVRSDKTLRIASDEELKDLLGRNLLIIGSPAVSHATRAVLRRSGATFLFNIGDEWFEREERLYDAMPPGAKWVQEELTAFLGNPANQDEIDHILWTYRKPGFVDPIDFTEIRGRAMPRDIDYGLIALAPNPWSERHVACICAGVHGGGTAGALQMLASPKNFEKHPWGGCFRVTTSDMLSWAKRFSFLSPRWETHEYTPERYLEQLAKLLDPHRKQAGQRNGHEDVTMAKIDVGPRTLNRVADFAKRLAEGRVGPATAKG
jgi:transcriptional regulator with XRE-family HTH domain